MNLICTKKQYKQFDFHPDFDRAILCHSDTANKTCISNNCPDELLENLARLSRLLGEIQNHLNGKRLIVNSGFRSVELNKKVGGVENSQHCQGLAADIICPEFGSARQLALAISTSGIEFDQLILEFDRWVHVSIHSKTNLPRQEILTLSKEAGYQQGIDTNG
jgi:zinc D-Ala-D-Ala carboxypeptidase